MHSGTKSGLGGPNWDQIRTRQVKWMEHQLAGIGDLSRLRELKEAFPGLTPQRYFVTPSPWAATTLLAAACAPGSAPTSLLPQAAHWPLPASALTPLEQASGYAPPDRWISSLSWTHCQ